MRHNVPYIVGADFIGARNLPHAIIGNPNMDKAWQKRPCDTAIADTNFYKFFTSFAQPYQPENGLNI
ncbi:hypothetical protein LPB140_05935 [Sphingorhabdus lutea]|uniref:Uncharacterized protein n=1 Tax=Sphingorhabdus lutea TaxID=1913578 RepID=A0A1L3JBA2_9SPHN|nr:hypothetical protein LPB140_05935 [Sphingorhabdus lutea]